MPAVWMLRCTKNSPAGEVVILPKEREMAIGGIENSAKEDKIYRAGVEAAPIFSLRVRNQPIFLDGVPSTSVVWKYIKHRNRQVLYPEDI
jgi:hypothetical protein